MKLKIFFANFQIFGPLGCQGWVVIHQNVKKSQNHCTLPPTLWDTPEWEIHSLVWEGLGRPNSDEWTDTLLTYTMYNPFTPFTHTTHLSWKRELYKSFLELCILNDDLHFSFCLFMDFFLKPNMHYMPLVFVVRPNVHHSPM